MPRISHVIFDLDGLLLDTESIFSAINVKLLNKYEKEFTPQLEHALMGTTTYKAVRLLLQETGINVTPEEYCTQFQAELDVELPNIKEQPGSTKLINYFYDKQIPIAICSGSNREEFTSKMENFQEWIHKIPIVVLGNDVQNCKPHPESYITTMQRFKCPPTKPEEVFVFEDAINGAKSAISAHATTILVSKHINKMLNSGQLNDILPNLSDTLLSLNDFDVSKYELISS